MKNFPKVRVDFIDGNAEWSEIGYLEAKIDKFVLHCVKPNGQEDGNRVFPLKGRTATIWFEDREEPMVIEEFWPKSVQQALDEKRGYRKTDSGKFIILSEQVRQS